MAARLPSLQDQFLNSLRRAKLPVTIFLVKGIKLQGVVTWFDSFSVLLRRDGSVQLIYKHAISTIVPEETPPDIVVAATTAQGARIALQDLFLAAAVRQLEQMTLFLVNGVMLEGVVTGFDQFSLLLERAGQVQLVYKHGISTLQPAHPLNLDAATDETGSAGEIE